MVKKEKKFVVADIRKAGKSAKLDSHDVEGLISALLGKGKKKQFPRLKKQV